MLPLPQNFWHTDGVPFSSHRRGQEVMHDWQYFFEPGNLDQGVYRIFENDRKSEILEWFSSEDVANEQKEALIQSLLDFYDDCGDFFRYRAYLLAAEAIAHFPQSAQADAIVGQLLKWSYAFCRLKKGDWKIYPPALTRAAREALKVTDRQRVVQQLTEVVCSVDSLSALRLSAKYLGEFDPGNRCAIAALEALSQYPQPIEGRFETAQSLASVAPGNAMILPTLIEIARSASGMIEKYQRILEWIIRGFRHEIGNESVITLLKELTQLLLHLSANPPVVKRPQSNYYDTYERYINERTIQRIRRKVTSLFHLIAGTLEKIGSDNDVAISTLILLSQHIRVDLKSYHDWSEVIEILGKIAVGHPTAIAQLSTLLIETETLSLRCDTAAALLRVDARNERAIATLREILATAQAQSIQPLSDSESQKITASTLWRAADSLGRNDPTYQPAIDALLQLAQTAISTTPCLPVINSLIHIDPTHQLALNALLKLVETSPDSSLYDTLHWFSTIGAGDDRVIEALVKLIQTTTSDFNRRSAASQLDRLDPGSALAIKTLKELSRSSEEREDWAIIYEYIFCDLRDMGINDRCALSVLVKFIQRFERVPFWQGTVGFADIFKSSQDSGLLRDVVRSLKDYLNPKCLIYAEDSEKNSQSSSASTTWQDLDGQRIEICHYIIWNCAQNMSYPDFHRAWHEVL
jgi:hypothetical protein